MKSIFDLYLRVLNETKPTVSPIEGDTMGMEQKRDPKSQRFLRKRTTVFHNTTGLIENDVLAAKLMPKGYWVACPVEGSASEKCYLEYKPKENKIYVYHVPYEDSKYVCMMGDHFQWYDKESGNQISPPNEPIDMANNDLKVAEKEFFFTPHIKMESSLNIPVVVPELKSLKGLPSVMRGSIEIDNWEHLESLEGCPQKIEKSKNHNICFFNVRNCGITSLEHMPKFIDGDFNIAGCINISSLQGCEDSKINGMFTCNYIKNLQTIDVLPNAYQINCSVSQCGSIKKMFNYNDVKDMKLSTPEDEWPDSLILIPYIGESDRVVRDRINKKFFEVISLYNTPTFSDETRKLIKEMLLSRVKYNTKRIFPIQKTSYKTNVLSLRVSQDGKTRYFDNSVSDNELTNGYDMIVYGMSELSSILKVKRKTGEQVFNTDNKKIETITIPIKVDINYLDQFEDGYEPLDMYRNLEADQEIRSGLPSARQPSQKTTII